MPVHIRLFYYKKLAKVKEQEEGELKKVKGGGNTKIARGPNVHINKG